MVPTSKPDFPTLRPSRRRGAARPLVAGAVAADALAGRCGTASAVPFPTPPPAPPAHLGTVGGPGCPAHPEHVSGVAFRVGFWQPSMLPIPIHGPIPGDPAPRDRIGVRMILRDGHAVDDPADQAQNGLGWLARYRFDGNHDVLVLAECGLPHRNITTRRTNQAAGTASWFPYPFTFDEYGSPVLWDGAPAWVPATG